MKDVNIKLIVGLGNVGSKYDGTRHNLGYDLLLDLAKSFNINLSTESKFFGQIGKVIINNKPVFLLFPTTFMNESGRSVAAVCNFYKIQPEEILVLHDELDINPGFIKLKFGGGFAGHNGLKSISSNLSGTKDFYRLRLGIGKPQKEDMINFVLGKPKPLEKELINDALNAAYHGIIKIFKEDYSKATAFINGFKPKDMEL